MQTKIRAAVSHRMGTVRGAFRCQRQARKHRGLWMSYAEQNLSELAKAERVLTIKHLLSAREQWRLTLGWNGVGSLPRIANV